MASRQRSGWVRRDDRRNHDARGVVLALILGALAGLAWAVGFGCEPIILPGGEPPNEDPYSWRGRAAD